MQGNAEVRETYERMAEHLAANGIDMEKDKLSLGPWLKMDPSSERFINDEKADRRLTRNYREPFVISTV